ncbi:transposase [Portibacter marinus]|uniref:transposase n=1 Tax=Portibacter marinus TaxID=2898660 RepID=UPI001F1EED9F|nr:transposase [Portibacter marinus]
MKKDKIFYRRNLPHIQPIGATFFITCSLKGAIPKEKLLELRNNYHSNIRSFPRNTDRQTSNFMKYETRRKYVTDLEENLHGSSGPNFLGNPDIARILLARIESYHMQYYKLLALSIMPNHFHMLIDTSIQIKSLLEPNTTPVNYVQLDQIMKLIKGGSARYINQKRGIIGEKVWEEESFDIYMRNEKMVQNVISYILDNPVKARLVNHYEEHPFTFVNLEV